MGYYANCCGFIEYSLAANEKQVEEMLDVLSYQFATYKCDRSRNGRKPYVDISFYDKYPGDECILEVLNEAAAILNITGGELTCAGEDDEHWRFLWRDGMWVMQAGEIVYRD